jgi:hypothetical protein
MIINSIQNSKYGKKYSVDKKFKLNLHLICIKRLENNDFELFDELVKRKFYEFAIFIDDLPYKIINSQSHDIKVYFINNITKEYYIVTRLNLNYHIDKYYYYDNEGNQQFTNNYVISDSQFIDIKDIDTHDKSIIKKIIKYKKQKKILPKCLLYLFLFLIYLIYFLFKDKTI